MVPLLIGGSLFFDKRGVLKFNNNFDASGVKRIYTIQNASETIERAWQGHQIEQRWFSAIKGTFTIKLIKIDNWETPSRNLEMIDYQITDDSLHVLYVPPGYVTSIKGEEPEALLLVMADYFLHEIKDEYKFPQDYFKTHK